MCGAFETISVNTYYRYRALILYGNQQCTIIEVLYLRLAFG